MLDLRLLDLNLLLAFEAIYPQRRVTRAAGVRCLSRGGNALPAARPA
jgi:hypothetical protein